MPRRSAATLVEVLVAIFVMGLGMLAILALFPLGALTMAQAIRDTRSAQAAQAAFARAKARDLFHDANLTNTFEAMINPNWLSIGYPPVNADGPSFPILMDPLAFENGTIQPDFVAPSRVLYRIAPTFRVNPPPSPPADTTRNRIYKWFCLLDDTYFDGDTAYPRAVGGDLDRDLKYSWAYLFQRPKWSEKEIIKCSVILFENRSLNTGLNQTEYSFSATVKQPNIYEIPNNIAPLKVGEWILDVTKITVNTLNGPVLHPQAFYARVVGITENVSGNLDIEIDRPITLINYPTNRTLVYFENAIGIY